MKCVLCTYGLPIEVVGGKVIHFIEHQPPGGKEYVQECCETCPPQQQQNVITPHCPCFDCPECPDIELGTWEGEGGRIS